MTCKQSWREVITVGDIVEFRSAEACKNYVYIGKPNELQEIGMTSSFELLAMEHIDDGGQIPYQSEGNHIKQLLRCTGNLRWEPIWSFDGNN